jgi:ATP-dependent Clp protease, protease subunit
LDDSANRPRPKPIGLLHTFYISGVIEDAKTYTDWFEVIRNANDTDLIKIHINSPGGDLFTAIQFMRVLNESNAMIIASVEGACMSAATMIFLCANQFEISEHSMFMFHNYSGMAIGKGGEMYDNITHERKWSEKIMRKVYENFLTEEEIKAILDNKDIWMEGEEVLKRLKLKQKVLEEKRMRKTNAKKPDPKS